MSKTPSAFRGSFNGYFQIYNSDGTLAPEVYPTNNLTDLQVTPEADDSDVVSTQNEDYGQAADSMVDAKPTKVSWTINRHTVDTMAVSFMGAATKRTAIQQTVTDEPVTFVLGGIIKLANLDISALTLTNAAGTTTYDVGDDYVILDAALGLISIPATSSIVDASAGLADYTAAAETGWKIAGGTNPSKFIKLFGKGINRYSNKRGILAIDKCSVRPSSGMALVGNDPATAGYEGTVITSGGMAWSFITEA